MSLLYILVGLAIGVLSGFFGIGGGFILTPVLLLLGFPTIIAISTSLMYSIGTSISGVVAHFRLKNIHWKTAIILAISGVIATQIANPFVLWLHKMQYDQTVIPLIYMIIIAYFAYSLLRKENVKTESKQEQTSRENIVKIIMIGFIGGFMSTTLGVGGGFIIVPLLISQLGYVSKKAVGTCLVAVFFIVTSGFISYSMAIEIPYQLGFYLIIGAFIGSQIGAKLTNIYKNKQIKFYFGLLYIATFLSILFELIHFAILGIAILILYLIILFIIFIKDSIQLLRSRKTVSEH